MKLFSTETCDCTLGEWMQHRSRGLRPGMLIHFDDKTSILIGDATPYIRPTTNDGCIGWGWHEDYCLKKVSRIEYYVNG